MGYETQTMGGLVLSNQPLRFLVSMWAGEQFNTVQPAEEDDVHQERRDQEASCQARQVCWHVPPSRPHTQRTCRYCLAAWGMCSPAKPHSVARIYPSVLCVCTRCVWMEVWVDPHDKDLSVYSTILTGMNRTTPRSQTRTKKTAALNSSQNCFFLDAASLKQAIKNRQTESRHVPSGVPLHLILRDS